MSGGSLGMPNDTRQRRTFVGSVSNCFANYATFSGRAPRAEFWYFFLFLQLVSFAAAIIDVATDAHIFGPLVALACFLPGTAVQVRRLHDLDRTGWWCGAYLVVVAIYFIAQDQGQGLGLAVLLLFAGGIVLWVWNCTRGTSGPNSYGADPLAGDARGPAPA